MENFKMDDIKAILVVFTMLAMAFTRFPVKKEYEERHKKFYDQHGTWMKFVSVLCAALLARHLFHVY